MSSPTEQAIYIIGSGAAGLITAHTLIQDGFQNIEILTRDSSPGGVWAAERVYPGLTINNVHGEFRFASLPMPPPSDAKTTGGRLSGEDMRAYMESFADRFLKGRIRYNTEVLNIRRQECGTDHRWAVSVKNTTTGIDTVLGCYKIVLCSGGCSEANVPLYLSSTTAKGKGFTGPVVHSSQFASNRDNVLKAVRPLTDIDPGHALVIGGGKSAQDIASYLANQGRKVSILFETADPFVAAPLPLPAFIRKSRFLAVISPHIELRTRLERFLHTTWLGSKIVQGIWSFLNWSSFLSLSIPSNSPLRRTHSLYYGVRTNDEGAGSSTGFHSLVNKGKIDLIAPDRAVGYGHDDDRNPGIMLKSGRIVTADAVVVATGFKSSWTKIFDQSTMDDIGMSRHSPTAEVPDEWSYTTLKEIPSTRFEGQRRASSIYRGLVPAKNILKRDFAINGAIFTTNNGYTYEVVSHWISSYFLEDPFLRLPSSPEQALISAARNTAWSRKRYPEMLAEINESYSSDLAFWSWPQAVDTLLDDMGLPIMRSGGNWLTWVFKVMDLKEIADLRIERERKRAP